MYVLYLYAAIDIPRNIDNLNASYVMQFKEAHKIVIIKCTALCN